MTAKRKQQIETLATKLLGLCPDQYVPSKDGETGDFVWRKIADGGWTDMNMEDPQYYGNWNPFESPVDLTMVKKRIVELGYTYHIIVSKEHGVDVILSKPKPFFECSSEELGDDEEEAFGLAALQLLECEGKP